jgi:hypothetical protein
MAAAIAKDFMRTSMRGVLFQELFQASRLRLFLAEACFDFVEEKWSE